jgi:hypothetical protein
MLAVIIEHELQCQTCINNSSFVHVKSRLTLEPLRTLPVRNQGSVALSNKHGYFFADSIEGPNCDDSDLLPLTGPITPEST